MIKKRRFFSIWAVVLVSSILMGFKTVSSSSTSYKCMVQLTNYKGEGAYIVISLIDPEGNYEKTLYVLGDDDEWYFDITEWWKFQGTVRTNIDAITGETISGGERSISVIDIEDDKLNAGYRLRFETAVEDQEYYTDDVEFELTSENVKGKFEGRGFIRYVRLLPQ